MDRAARHDEKNLLLLGLAALGAEEVARRLSLGGKRKGDMERQSGGVLVRCPSHGDRTASLSITRGPDRTLRARCFGCDLAGDAFTLIAAVHGLDARISFSTVLHHARELLGGTLPGPAPRHENERPDDVPPALDDETFDRLARWLLDQCPLESSSDGVAYLRRRGLLGLARGRLGCLPPVPRQTMLIEAMCSELGEHVWSRSGLAHPKVPTRFAWGENRLLIPWCHAGVDGLIANVQRRTLGSVTHGPKYASARFRTFPAPFGIEDAVEEVADDSVPLVIVEGALDTLAARALFAEEGRHVAIVGIPGCQGWRASWANLGRGREVKIGTDPDEAGEKAAVQIATDLHDAGATSVMRIRLKAHDWAEAVAS